MLKQLILENWQCHIYLQVDFDKITVFTGPNDAGKSAILRALKFVCLNDWDGEADAHVTWGAAFSKLTLITDKHTIVRKKGPSVNTYELDGEEYKAFGQGGVPESISKALNLSPESFQDQSEPAFWLYLSSGQAASALNEIFSLTAIDNALSNIGRELRETQTEKRLVEERLTKAKEQYTLLEWTEQADKDLTLLESIREKIQQNEQEIKSLTLLQAEMQKIAKIQKSASQTISLGEETIQVGERLLAIEEEIKQLNRILAWKERMNYNSKSLKETEEKLKELLKETCPLCGR